MKNWNELLVFIGCTYISVVATLTSGDNPIKTQDARIEELKIIQGGRK